MGLHFRKKIQVLPGVSINLSKFGASVNLKPGPVSWNSRTGKTRINLPGLFSYQFDLIKLNELTKTELINLAKQHGLKDYSQLNKQELIEFLKQNRI